MNQVLIDIYDKSDHIGLRGKTMNWIDLVPFLVVLGGLGTMWWRLNSRIDTLDGRIDGLDAKFDAKFDALNKLLTDNLIALNRDIGELKGAAHTHTTPAAN